ncbi:MAG: cation diffusion facilitator family transporter [Chthonomonadales bacterium]
MKNGGMNAGVNGDTVAAARLSILSNTFLTVLKLIVGLTSGSVSVLSEAAHSGMDLVASWIAYFSVRVSARPADDEHPYGHGKIESVSGMTEALLIFAAAGFIIFEAVRRILAHQRPPEVGAGLVVMGMSTLVNAAVSAYLFRVAHRADSLALRADAEHLRTDVYTSLGVFAGLLLVRLTHVGALDGVAAICVACLIIAAAWRLSRSALEPLLDTRLPAADIAVIKGILDRDPRVMGYHKLRTRKSGAARHVDAHILVEDQMSLMEAHELTEQLEDEVRRRLPNAEVTLHTEPYQAELRHQYEKHGGPLPDEETDPQRREG